MSLHIFINSNSRIPKYKQIVNSIINEIEKGNLTENQQIPSINEISEEYYLSRDTVEKAYAELKERGVITSVRGKGFFINNLDDLNKVNIFLLLNKISTYKKTIYNSFIKALGDKAFVDLYIHHNDFRIFKNLIEENIGNYNQYVIIPPFSYEPEKVLEVIEKIPQNKLLILEKDLEENSLSCSYASVYQDFKNDIYDALFSGLDLLEKYNKLILVFPSLGNYSKDVQVGFRNFCTDYSFEYVIINEVREEFIQAKSAYVVVEEEELVKIIKLSKEKNLNIGIDIGIISYNDTPLKEILLDGITVVSTEFETMGETAAKLILEKSQQKIKNPFRMIRRKSL